MLVRNLCQRYAKSQKILQSSANKENSRSSANERNGHNANGLFPWEEKQPNAAGALVKMDGVCAGMGGTMIYFQCEDCSVEESRVEAAGGKVHQPKMSIG